MDAILVSCAGGALIAGIAMATKVMSPRCKVIAVEPQGKDLGKCLKTKQRLWSDPPRFLDTVAESIRLEQVGELTFPLLCDLVEPGLGNSVTAVVSKSLMTVLL